MAFEPLNANEDPDKEFSLGDYAARQTALAARAAITPTTVGMAAGAGMGALAAGVGAAPGAVAGAGAGFLTDIGARIYNALVAENTGTGKVPVLGDELERIKDQIGLPRPKGAVETMQQRTIEGVTSLVPIAAGGRILEQAAKSPALKELGKALYKSPRVQLTSAAAGGLASGAAEAEGGGPITQAAAGLAAGAVAPSIARVGSVYSQARNMGMGRLASGIASTFGITESSRAAGIRLLRGGKDPAVIQGNIDKFADAGTTPSAGQATGSPIIQQTETTMGRFPSAYATMREKGISQQAEIGQRIEQIRAGISKVREPEIAGRRLRGGFEAVFVPQARRTQRNLYNVADSMVPDLQADLPRTVGKLDEMAQRFAGAPELQAVLGNRQLGVIREAIQSSRNAEGKIPFQVLRDLRTTIGEKLENVDLTPDVSRAEYKALYRALTEDLTEAVAPLEKARNAYARANNYTRAFHDRMDRVQDILTKQNGEEVYRAVVMGAKDGPSRLRAVMRSVPKEDQRALVSAFVAKMGRALPGLQDETGEVFSTSRFLTNYASLDKASRRELFGKFGQQFTNDMDNIAEVSAKIRESSQILANPSGTAGAVVGPATVASVGGSIFSGKFGFAAGMLNVLMSANQSARLFTNPRYVRWLASNIEKPVSYAGAAMANLATIAQQENDPDIRAFIEEVEEQAR